MPNGRQIMAALTANASVISRPLAISHPSLSSPALSSTVHDNDVDIESPVMTEATLAAKFSDNRELAKSARHSNAMKKHIGGRNTPYGITMREQAHPPRTQVYYFYLNTN
jgi:hypothetical protein